MVPPDRTPEELARTDTLTREEKIERLRRWAYDVRERLVASEEGMTRPVEDGDEASLLTRILRALGELGFDGEVVAGPPTKHG